MNRKIMKGTVTLLCRATDGGNANSNVTIEIIF